MHQHHILKLNKMQVLELHHKPTELEALWLEPDKHIFKGTTVTPEYLWGR